MIQYQSLALQWRHNERDGITNHQPHDCLLSCLFRRRSKKTSKLRATGLCVGNSPVTCEFPAQMASNAENVSIWWRHHVYQHVPSANRKINQCDINHSNLTTGSFQTDILIRTQFYCLPNSVYNSITVSPQRPGTTSPLLAVILVAVLSVGIPSLNTEVFSSQPQSLYPDTRGTSHE